MALKLLQSHPRSNGKFGTTGHSRGGTNSFFLADVKLTSKFLGGTKGFDAILPEAAECRMAGFFAEPELTSNTKLLVVLSDGMTRGSLPELKNSINFAKRNKIEVLGVGIGNRGSWKEYENNVQVQHPEQLIYYLMKIDKIPVYNMKVLPQVIIKKQKQKKIMIHLQKMK